MELYLYLALFAPLVGSLFAALFGASPKTKLTGYVTSGLLFVSFVSSAILLNYVMSGHTVHVELMTWMATGDLYIPFGFVVDQVSVVMMMVV
ncbi:MAG: NADH-quinone oxidoreductase subunit L, partial [Sulfuricurvum sp.]|nr:NADH-quinone oxidoreductase subunit L [Sulfuricurvum sp.]